MEAPDWKPYMASTAVELANEVVTDWGSITSSIYTRETK